MKTRLERALEQACAPEGDVARAVHALGDYSIRRARDAAAIVEFLDLAAEGRVALPAAAESGLVSPLHAVVGLFQEVSSRKAFLVLATRGVPLLLRLFDARIAAADEDDAESLLFLLKVAVMYQSPGAAMRLAQAARSPALSGHYLWSVTLSIVSDQGEDFSLEVYESLRSPLPAKFAAVAYLDFCNAICRRPGAPRHPFDTPAGHERLELWLRSGDADEHTFAHSAAAALPFLVSAAREPLLALALDHPRVSVQLEGAWASARLGSVAGLKVLKRFCLDPRHSSAARDYLDELGRGDEIPPQACEPGFEAMAEMCRWLAHPLEFGAPPDEIELYDSAEMHWPPTDDVRRLWLFRYAYRPGTTGAEPASGVGMVGSITFALFGESTADKTPDDIYALHCCWELQRNGDPRAPSERTVAAGRAILERFQ